MRARVPFVLCLFLLFGVTVSTGQGPVDVVFDPATHGAWSAPFAWPVKGEHLALLATGEVLSFEGEHEVILWDPTTGSFTDVSLGGDVVINCAGLGFLPDGRLVTNGGFGDDFNLDWPGNNATFLFDPFSREWTRGPDMHTARYYPTTLTLADGRVLTMDGNNETGRSAGAVEILDMDGSSWTVVEGADREMDFFPRLHVLPDGRLVRVAQEKETLYLDVTTGTWTEGPSSSMHRWGSASILLPGLEQVLLVGGGSMGSSGEGGGPIPGHRDDPDKVVQNNLRGIFDGGGPATATAEILDLSTGTATAEWRPTGSLNLPRRDLAAILLPDGTVMAFNGGAGYEMVPGWVDHTLFPERYDPSTERWDLMAPAERHRGYHSGALLLPDGHVLVAGGDFEWATGTSDAPLTNTAELYSPPYLFHGERPLLTVTPTVLPYKASTFVGTPEPTSIEKVVLVRSGTMTHSINQEQRLIELTHLVVPGGIVVEGPAHGGEAPPGRYMLFVFDDQGVPAIAPIVDVK